jgi:hypothetical protein
MKPIRFTAHAEAALVDRGISRSEVEAAIRGPDRRELARPPREVVSRAYLDKVADGRMLLRVFIEESELEISVITLYKTSKLKKYLPEENQ